MRYKKSFYGRNKPSYLSFFGLCGGCMNRVPGTRYAAPGTRRSTLEYLQRALVQYSCTCIIIAGLPHILISSTISEASRARFRFTSSANTPITLSEGNLIFLSEGKPIHRNLLPQTLQLKRFYASEQSSTWLRIYT